METDEPLAEPLKADDRPPKAEEPKELKSKAKSTPTIDSFIKFKSPGDKSPTKPKLVPSNVKTPIKTDILNEVAMPSWSDNSSQDIIKPPATQEAIVIEDSEDFKLVYEESVMNNSADSQPAADQPEESLEKKAEVEIKIPQSPETKIEEIKIPQSPESKKGIESEASPTSSKPNEARNFFKQAKVTDLTEAVVNKVVASPKTPRRVSFVTLSSPKNSKKK